MPLWVADDQLRISTLKTEFGEYQVGSNSFSEKIKFCPFDGQPYFCGETIYLKQYNYIEGNIEAPPNQYDLWLQWTYAMDYDGYQNFPITQFHTNAFYAAANWVVSMHEKYLEERFDKLLEV